MTPDEKRSTVNDWQLIVEFYERLVVNHPYLQGMIELVNQIKHSKNFQSIHPSTSLAALGLSTAQTYENRLLLPMIYVELLPTSGRFKIHFQQRPGKDVRSIEAASPLSELIFSEMLAWLEVSQNNAT